jgi:hypothetical protein
MVRPEDRANLLKVFQVNNCLWGGLFNPIIPFFKRVPAWWERNGIKFDNASDPGLPRSDVDFTQRHEAHSEAVRPWLTGRRRGMKNEDCRRLW